MEPIDADSPVAMAASPFDVKALFQAEALLCSQLFPLVAFAPVPVLRFVLFALLALWFARCNSVMLQSR
jgi:hypothetical protein